MRDLPLFALRALAAVHAHGGVRAAARELGIAHSSVSRHLAELEKWLGVKLLERAAGPRAFALTPQGEALGEAAFAALRSLANAAASVREAKSAASLTISTTASVATRWLLPRMSDFTARHRGIEMSVVVEQKLDDLRAPGIDLALRMGRGPWPDLHCEPFMDDAIYPVMSPALFAKAGSPHSPERLAGLHLLHDRDPHATWAKWREAHGPAELDLKKGARFASSDLVLRAAALGLGVALARHRLAADDVAAGGLVRPFGDRVVVLTDAYWIVMPSRSRDRRAIQAACAWLKQQALACGQAA
jgi:LysR family glycine cleavage system transcriptional activator